MPVFSLPGESGRVVLTHPRSTLKKDLLKGLNDRSRKVSIRGKSAIVPLKFDKDGNIATPDTLVLKRLSLTDLRFLSVWRANNWDLSKSITDSGLTQEKAERLVKKLSCFRDEDAKVKALAEIPTPSWIKSKHVENFYEGGTLEESQHKSLAELAKIEGAYKSTTNINVQNNVFQMPQLTPEQAAELKALGDKLAAVDAEVL